MKRSVGVHTVPLPPGVKVWCNKVDGTIASLHITKRRAVQLGRWIAKELKAEHTIDRKDG